MKNCIECGAAAPDDAPACTQCGRKFSFVSGMTSADSPVSTIAGLRERPDGSRLLLLGWIAMALGVILFFVSLSGTPRSTYYGPDIDELARQWMFATMSAAFFGLSLVLLLAGIIVRAIWFLPGPDFKAPPDRVLAQGSSGFVAGASYGRPGEAGDDGAVV